MEHFLHKKNIEKKYFRKFLYRSTCIMFHTHDTCDKICDYITVKVL